MSQLMLGSCVIDKRAQEDPRYNCDTINAWPSKCPTNGETKNGVTSVGTLYKMKRLLQQGIVIGQLNCVVRSANNI